MREPSRSYTGGELFLVGHAEVLPARRARDPAQRLAVGGTRTVRVLPSRSLRVTVAALVPSATVYTGTPSSRARRATVIGFGPVVE